MSSTAGAGTRSGRPGPHLWFAAAGVLLTASDTYVVVVALPTIMTSVGLGLDHLQRATPVVSGFLLGYVAVLPLLGRLADLAGKRPVFVACLGAFAAGSLITATAHGLGLLVAGRALQGLGGGGLVPVTLALVAQSWPPERRGLPLGVIGAVQELGSVLGPLYGAVVVSAAGWRWIFWLNLPLTAAIAGGFLLLPPRGAAAAAPPGGESLAPGGQPGGAGQATGPLRTTGVWPGHAVRHDPVGAALCALAVVAAFLALDAPAALAQGVATGRLWSPLAHGPSTAPLTTPMAFVTGALLAALLGWELLAPATTLRRLRSGWPSGMARRADLPSAALLAGLLACVVIVFSTTDPGTEVVASSAVVLGPVAAVLAVSLAWRQRCAAEPLLAALDLSRRPAWGAMAVNLATGAALISALVDVPLFVRGMGVAGTQLGAALVLVRLLAAVPVGAVIGGLALRRSGAAAGVSGLGLALAAGGFVTMTSWSATTFSHPLVGPIMVSDVELVACGLGFGLAIAPVNAAVLAAVPARAHGLATGLAVVARTVGMLAGLSVLTAVGLHRFYASESRIPSPTLTCPGHPLACPAYNRATEAALATELHTVFLGAALCAAAASVLCLLLRPAQRPSTPRGRRDGSQPSSATAVAKA